MQDVVGYLPTINAPVTQLSTASKILRQSEGIGKILNLTEIVVVMDQHFTPKLVRSPGSTKISTLKFFSGWELFIQFLTLFNLI